MNNNVKDDKKYRCDECLYAAPSNSALRVHRIKHSDERSYKCDYCGSLFKYSQDMSRHIKKEHPNSEELGEDGDNSDTTKPVFYGFKEVNSMQNDDPSFHFNNDPLTAHGSEKMEANGNVNHLEFSVSGDGIIDSTGKKEKKSYSCSICNKKFAYPSLLQCHLISHSAEKPYKCPYSNKGCTKAYKRKKNVTAHASECPFKSGRCELMEGFDDDNLALKKNTSSQKNEAEIVKNESDEKEDDDSDLVTESYDDDTNSVTERAAVVNSLNDYNNTRGSTKNALTKVKKNVGVDANKLEILNFNEKNVLNLLENPHSHIEHHLIAARFRENDHSCNNDSHRTELKQHLNDDITLNNKENLPKIIDVNDNPLGLARINLDYKQQLQRAVGSKEQEKETGQSKKANRLYNINTPDTSDLTSNSSSANTPNPTVGTMSLTPTIAQVINSNPATAKAVGTIISRDTSTKPYTQTELMDRNLISEQSNYQQTVMGQEAIAINGKLFFPAPNYVDSQMRTLDKLDGTHIMIQNNNPVGAYTQTQYEQQTMQQIRQLPKQERFSSLDRQMQFQLQQKVVMTTQGPQQIANAPLQLAYQIRTNSAPVYLYSIEPNQQVIAPTENCNNMQIGQQRSKAQANTNGEQQNPQINNCPDSNSKSILRSAQRTAYYLYPDQPSDLNHVNNTSKPASIIAPSSSHSCQTECTGNNGYSDQQQRFEDGAWINMSQHTLNSSNASLQPVYVFNQNQGNGTSYISNQFHSLTLRQDIAYNSSSNSQTASAYESTIPSNNVKCIDSFCGTREQRLLNSFQLKKIPNSVPSNFIKASSKANNNLSSHVSFDSNNNGFNFIGKKSNNKLATFSGNENINNNYSVGNDLENSSVATKQSDHNASDDDNNNGVNNSNGSSEMNSNNILESTIQQVNCVQQQGVPSLLRSTTCNCNSNSIVGNNITSLSSFSSNDSQLAYNNNLFAKYSSTMPQSFILDPSTKTHTFQTLLQTEPICNFSGSNNIYVNNGYASVSNNTNSDNNDSIANNNNNNENDNFTEYIPSTNPSRCTSNNIVKICDDPTNCNMLCKNCTLQDRGDFSNKKGFPISSSQCNSGLSNNNMSLDEEKDKNKDSKCPFPECSYTTQNSMRYNLETHKLECHFNLNGMLKPTRNPMTISHQALLKHLNILHMSINMKIKDKMTNKAIKKKINAKDESEINTELEYSLGETNMFRSIKCTDGEYVGSIDASIEPDLNANYVIYMCNHCAVVYSSVSQLRLHQKTIHRDFSVLCNCGYSYYRNKGLHYHLKNYH